MRRRVFACTDLEPLAALADWPGLTTVLAVENIRGINGRGKVTAEIRYYLSSAQLPPKRLATAIRSHWGIENGLHWVLDVGFNEDASRVRERTAARNLALLRKIALNFARANTHTEGQPEGQAQVRRLGRRLHGDADRRLISCVTPVADPPPGALDSLKTVDGERGRIESRRHAVCHDVAWLFSDRRYPGEPAFPGLAMLGMVESEVERGGKAGRERRYYLGSAGLDPGAFARAVRGHRGIENRLHGSWT